MTERKKKNVIVTRWIAILLYFGGISAYLILWYVFGLIAPEVADKYDKQILHFFEYFVIAVSITSFAIFYKGESKKRRKEFIYMTIFLSVVVYIIRHSVLSR